MRNFDFNKNTKNSNRIIESTKSCAPTEVNYLKRAFGDANMGFNYICYHCRFACDDARTFKAHLRDNPSHAPKMEADGLLSNIRIAAPGIHSKCTCAATASTK